MMTYRSIYFLSILFIATIVPYLAGDAQPQKQPAVGEVISPAQFTRKQVGGGKAVIEIMKEGKAAFIGRLTLAPNGSVPQHRDPTEEYLIVQSGKGELTLDGIIHVIKPGDVIYMPAKAEVSFKNGSEPFVALQIFAGPSSARKYDRWAPVTQSSKP